ncbi:MAG TPA: hypothetical protein VK578_22110, partial [Edaphobacter sp.]|nr:hypothetical protein [Edaphobacter sp.]
MATRLETVQSSIASSPWHRVSRKAAFYTNALTVRKNPIWHEIVKQEQIAYSPSLAVKVARSNGTHNRTDCVAHSLKLHCEITISDVLDIPIDFTGTNGMFNG